MHAAPFEEVSGLCLGPFAPRRRDSVARPARAASWAFWRGRPAGNRDCVLVRAVATKTLWGNCVSARVETPRGPDSARARFLIAPRRSVHFFVDLPDRTRLRPEELVRYACHRFRGRCASRRHSPRHADVSVSWRDRPGRCRPGSQSEASSPGSDAPCRERRAGRGADTPAIFIVRVGTVTTRTAPAFGWPLAPRYGSDLLTLRLLSLLQRGDVFFHAASLRRFDELCQVRSLPAAALPLRARSE